MTRLAAPFILALVALVAVGEFFYFLQSQPWTANHAVHRPANVFLSLFMGNKAINPCSRVD